MTEQCGNCRFSNVEVLPAEAPGEDDSLSVICRRFPPIALGAVISSRDEDGGAIIGQALGHPFVEPSDWCGEWQGEVE